MLGCASTHLKVFFSLGVWLALKLYFITLKYKVHDCRFTSFKWEARALSTECYSLSLHKVIENNTANCLPCDSCFKPETAQAHEHTFQIHSRRVVNYTTGLLNFSHLRFRMTRAPGEFVHISQGGN